MVRLEEADQLSQHLARHRSRKHVAADHDVVDGSVASLVEHRLERREIAVRVIESGNAHR